MKRIARMSIILMFVFVMLPVTAFAFLQEDYDEYEMETELDVEAVKAAPLPTLPEKILVPMDGQMQFRIKDILETDVVKSVTVSGKYANCVEEDSIYYEYFYTEYHSNMSDLDDGPEGYKVDDEDMMIYNYHDFDKELDERMGIVFFNYDPDYDTFSDFSLDKIDSIDLSFDVTIQRLDEEYVLHTEYCVCHSVAPIKELSLTLNGDVIPSTEWDDDPTMRSDLRTSSFSRIFPYDPDPKANVVLDDGYTLKEVILKLDEDAGEEFFNTMETSAYFEDQMDTWDTELLVEINFMDDARGVQMQDYISLQLKK